MQLTSEVRAADSLFQINKLYMNAIIYIENCVNIKKKNYYCIMRQEREEIDDFNKVSIFRTVWTMHLYH